MEMFTRFSSGESATPEITITSNGPITDEEAVELATALLPTSYVQNRVTVENGEPVSMDYVRVLEHTDRYVVSNS